MLLYSVFVVHLGRSDVLSVILPFMCMVYATHEGFIYIYERERPGCEGRTTGMFYITVVDTVSLSAWLLYMVFCGYAKVILD